MKTNVLKLLKNYFNKKWIENVNGKKNRYLDIQLIGGLSNKLYYLFSACEIAIKKNAFLIEPEFGWNEKILFSDIFDLDYFNDIMSKYYDGKKIMISRKMYNESSLYKESYIKNSVNLWEFSEKILKEERKSCTINKNSFKLKVLEALKLKKEYLLIVDQYSNVSSSSAIQIRVESDWEEYSKITKTENNEIVLVDIDKLMEMLAEFGLSDFFFTTGENQEGILKKIKEYKMNAIYFFDSSLEYEINAAINFEICCLAKDYIGLSRSSFSNLITLKRAALLNNDNSYIYNYNNKILKRVDLGLQPVASLSISKKTSII